MTQFEQIASRAIESGGKLRVRSALNPILWLTGIISPTSLVASTLITPTPDWLISLIFFPVAASVAGYFVLLFKDPDKLQSEDYQIRKRSLELIEQKGDAAPIKIDSNTLNIIPKPAPIIPGPTDT